MAITVNRPVCACALEVGTWMGDGTDGEAPPRIKSRGRKMAALSLKLRAREAYFTLRAKTDISPASRGGERSAKNLEFVDECNSQIPSIMFRTRLGPNWTCGGYGILVHGKQAHGLMFELLYGL